MVKRMFDSGPPAGVVLKRRRQSSGEDSKQLAAASQTEQAAMRRVLDFLRSVGFSGAPDVLRDTTNGQTTAHVPPQAWYAIRASGLR